MTQPPYDSAACRSTGLGHPVHAPVRPTSTTNLSGRAFSPARHPPLRDLFKTNGHAALGERIIVEGQMTDEGGEGCWTLDIRLQAADGDVAETVSLDI